MSTDSITRSNQTTRSTDVFSLRENLPHCRAADACLTGAARVYLYQSAPSIFGFVRNLGDKGSPSSIVNRLGEHAASQAFDVQVFDNNRSEILYQPERETMLKFVSLIPGSSVNLWEQCDGFTAAMRTLFAACNLSLRPSKFGFRLPIPSRIRNGRAISEGREVFESKVDSNGVIERRQWFDFAFDRKTHVPFTALAFDRDRLNCARNRAVEFDFQFAYTLNAQGIASQFNAIAVTWERKAVEPTTRLEPRITRGLVPLHTKEERFESLVHPSKDILAARKVCEPEVARSANIFELVRLVVVVQRFLVAVIGVATFLQRAVIESAGFAKLSVECFRLEARRE